MTWPDGFWCLQFKDFLTLIVLIVTVWAIYIGPIQAVKVSQKNDELRSARQRQYQIFHNLMKTRRSVLLPEHVSSLNLIQIEFYGDEKIVSSYKKYIDLLSRERPETTDRTEKINRFYKEQDDGFFQLVHDIGKALGFTLDKSDLEKYSYSPQGWMDNDTQILTMRKLLVELLSGRRSLPVSQLDLAKVNKMFPPPPAA